MQEEIVKPSALFDDAGNLNQTGWAKRLLLDYNRDKMQASLLRLKEWDCYVMMNPEFCISLIVADVGYFGMATIEWIDFTEQEAHGDIGLKLFTKGKLNLPPTADTGDVLFEKKAKWLKFEHDPQPERGIINRVLSFEFPKFKWRGKRGIKGQITLEQPTNMDTMVNVIPFEDPKHFVYVQKIVDMPATGTVEVGDETHEFRGLENGSWGALDWSRGVFPYKTWWWWAYASGIVNNVPFGFNIDYGFGTEANKSMLFYDGTGHHLDEVTYTWDDEDLMKPWQFTSNDGRVNLQLEPVHKQKMNLNMLVLSTKTKHVYGWYTGEVVLDDGTTVKITKEDRLFGSAEHCRHKW